MDARTYTRILTTQGLKAAQDAVRAERNSTPPAKEPVKDNKQSQAEYQADLAAQRAKEIVKRRATERETAVPPYDGNIHRRLLELGFDNATPAGALSHTAQRRRRNLQILAEQEDARLAQQARIDASIDAVNADPAVVAIRERTKALFEFVATTYMIRDNFGKPVSGDKVLDQWISDAHDLRAQGLVEPCNFVLSQIENRILEKETAIQAQAILHQQPALAVDAESKKRLAALRAISSPAPVQTPASATGEPAPARARVFKWTPEGLKLESEPEIEGGDNASQE